MGDPLFERGKIYTVLEVREPDIYMYHILYANEYGPLHIDIVKVCFYNVKETRKKKLSKINQECEK